MNFNSIDAPVIEIFICMLIELTLVEFWSYSFIAYEFAQGSFFLPINYQGTISMSGAITLRQQSGAYILENLTA